MKNIKIIHDCIVYGTHTEAGTVLRDVESHLAADLITSGRAVEAKATAVDIESRDPVVENRDPKPKKSPKRRA